MNLKDSKITHKPVLLDQILREFKPRLHQTYLDVTAGGGGHARALAKVLGYKNLSLVDLDPLVIKNLSQEFSQSQLYNSNFALQAEILRKQNQSFDFILADLGLSNLQLNQVGRGFSFKHNDQLDMRFNNKDGDSLLELLKQVNYQELATVLTKYGQEAQALRIAKRIKSEQPETTFQLAELVARLKPKNSRIHPSTKTFMALRIWVNNELGSLEDFLKVAPLLLKPQGKLAIISFHSLEDKLVKASFKTYLGGQYDASYCLQTKKPIVPDSTTLKDHPESRSAKLRILKRL